MNLIKQDKNCKTQESVKNDFIISNENELMSFRSYLCSNSHIKLIEFNMIDVEEEVLYENGKVSFINLVEFCKFVYFY